jgi:phosphate/sulfate permease
MAFSSVLVFLGVGVGVVLGIATAWARVAKNVGAETDHTVGN